MSTIYGVTGAMGHLGGTVVRVLAQRGERVRALALPGDASKTLTGVPAEMFTGDVRHAVSLEPFLTVPKGDRLVVIHAAGIVSIASKFDQNVYDVNVKGTQNIVDGCLRHRAERLVHVSSVHAIPPGEKGETITEVDSFRPDRVEGLYARTKAEATQRVLDATLEGLDAVVVHPSGILGPGDYGHGHLTQLIKDFLDGRLTACVNGGYDFVDVRDVTDGILSAAESGRTGECYILSGAFCTIPVLLRVLAEVSGKKPIRMVLPTWFAKFTAPLAETYYKILRQPPLYTAYSLYTLSCPAKFSHGKAELELGYHPRSLTDTLRDTVAWLRSQGLVKPFRGAPQPAG